MQRANQNALTAHTGGLLQNCIYLHAICSQLELAGHVISSMEDDDIGV